MSAVLAPKFDRDAAIAREEQQLKDEVRSAFSRGGDVLVRVSDGLRWPLTDVVSDHLAEIGTEPKWRDIVDVLYGASRGNDVSSKAHALIEWFAERHAYWHASDIVDGEQS